MATLPAEIAPQLATLVDAPPRGPGWLYEIKFDGYRILARIERGRVRLFTRNANDWTARMASLAAEIARLPIKSGWLDGEVVVLDSKGVPDFNALQNAFDQDGTERITIFVFDALFVDGKDLRGEPLTARREALEAAFAGFESDRVRLSQVFDADGQSMLNSACRMGLEGVIAKKAAAPYRGTRTDTWLKVKCQRRQEFVIAGFVPRAGSTNQIGSLLLGVYDDDGRLRYAGSVGTGWDAMLARAMFRQLEKIETPKMPFDPEFPPKKGRWSRRAPGEERWVKPTLVCEVMFTEWTLEGHVRHPSFKGIRKDKSAKGVRREAPA